MHSAVELFKKALYHEVKSEVYYNKAAEITKNDESRMLFLELSDMEGEHIRHIIDKTKGISFPTEFDPGGYVKGLESSLESTISVDESEILKTGDMKTVLELAIGMEKEAMKTYLALAEKEFDSEVKDFCKKLAKEEEEHFKSLTNLLNSLDMDEEDRPAL